MSERSRGGGEGSRVALHHGVDQPENRDRVKRRLPRTSRISKCFSQVRQQLMIGQGCGSIVGEVLRHNQKPAIKQRTERDLPYPAAVELEAGPAFQAICPSRTARRRYSADRPSGERDRDARVPAKYRADQVAARRQISDDGQQARDHRSQPGIVGALRRPRPQQYRVRVPAVLDHHASGLGNTLDEGPVIPGTVQDVTARVIAGHLCDAAAVVNGQDQIA